MTGRSPDRDVDVGLDARVGRRLEQGVRRRAGRVDEQPDHHRDEERGEDRADQEGQPAAPADLRTDEPDEDAAERRHRRRKSRYSSRPRTHRASSTDQARVRHSRSTRPRVSQPSAGASGIARAFIGRGSPRAAGPGVIDERLQLVLGQRVAQGAGALGGELVGLGIGSRRCRRSPWPCGFRDEPLVGGRVEGHHDAGDAARAERGERPDPGRIERRRDDRPRSSPGGAARRSR